MAILTARLTGNSGQKPRQKTAYNLWGPKNRCFVDPIFKERVLAGDVPSKQQAALRSAIYKELLEELPQEEQQEWIEQAEKEHREAMQKADSALTSEASSAQASSAPADHQR